jgi:hypothetical protein
MNFCEDAPQAKKTPVRALSQNFPMGADWAGSAFISYAALPTGRYKIVPCFTQSHNGSHQDQNPEC